MAEFCHFGLFIQYYVNFEDIHQLFFSNFVIYVCYLRTKGLSFFLSSFRPSYYISPFFLFSNLTYKLRGKGINFFAYLLFRWPSEADNDKCIFTNWSAPILSVFNRITRHTARLKNLRKFYTGNNADFVIFCTVKLKERN